MGVKLSSMIILWCSSTSKGQTDSPADPRREEDDVKGQTDEGKPSIGAARTTSRVPFPVVFSVTNFSYGFV